MNKKNQEGFTLYELLITVAVLAIIVTAAGINLIGYKSRHSFELDSENIVNAIRNAQDRAILGDQGSAWGVTFVNNVSEDDYYEVFSGSSYTAQNVVMHEGLNFSSEFQVPASGASSTISFAPISGIPSASTTLVLTRKSSTETYTIMVSRQGAVNRAYSSN